MTYNHRTTSIVQKMFAKRAMINEAYRKGRIERNHYLRMGYNDTIDRYWKPRPRKILCGFIRSLSKKYAPNSATKFIVVPDNEWEQYGMFKKHGLGAYNGHVMLQRADDWDLIIGKVYGDTWLLVSNWKEEYIKALETWHIKKSAK